MWEICDEARRPAGQDPDVVGLGVRFVCPFGLGLAQRQSRSPPVCIANVGFSLSRLLLPSPAPRA